MVNVASPDVLKVHAEPSARSLVVAAVPADARGLKNLGCTGLPTFQQWTAMTPSERERSSRARWCRISYAGTRGWAAGRFLKEAGTARSTRKTVGPWTLVCDTRPCAVEQAGLGSKQATTLRLEASGAGNATVIIARPRLPRQGILAIHMDGELLSSGPVAPLVTANGRQLRLPPDDLTAGLMREMRRRRTMVLSFPGETGGVEFHLDHVQAATAAGDWPQP